MEKFDRASFEEVEKKHKQEKDAFIIGAHGEALKIDNNLDLKGDDTVEMSLKNEGVESSAVEDMEKRIKIVSESKSIVVGFERVVNFFSGFDYEGLSDKDAGKLKEIEKAIKVVFEPGSARNYVDNMNHRNLDTYSEQKSDNARKMIQEVFSNPDKYLASIKRMELLKSELDQMIKTFVDEVFRSAFGK